jgi:hypothetical protein
MYDATNIRDGKANKNQSIPLSIGADTLSFFHSQSSSRRVCLNAAGLMIVKRNDRLVVNLTFRFDRYLWFEWLRIIHWFII